MTRQKTYIACGWLLILARVCSASEGPLLYWDPSAGYMARSAGASLDAEGSLSVKSVRAEEGIHADGATTASFALRAGDADRAGAATRANTSKAADTATTATAALRALDAGRAATATHAAHALAADSATTATIAMQARFSDRSSTATVALKARAADTATTSVAASRAKDADTATTSQIALSVPGAMLMSQYDPDGDGMVRDATHAVWADRAETATLALTVRTDVSVTTHAMSADWATSAGLVSSQIGAGLALVENPETGVMRIVNAGDADPSDDLTRATLFGQTGGHVTGTYNNLLVSMTDGLHGARGGGSLHALATREAHGFMSKEDKTKLDGLVSGGAGGTGGPAYGRVTDGTTAAQAESVLDQLRFKSSGTVSALVRSNDSTYGDYVTLSVIAESLPLADLKDVQTAPAPAHQSLLAYDASQAKWVNKTAMNCLNLEPGGGLGWSVEPGTGVERLGVQMSDALHGARGGGSLHTAATGVQAGFMSAADKTKLDGLAATSALADLADVELASLQADQILKWNGSKWVNAAAAAASGSVPLAGGTMTGALLGGVGKFSWKLPETQSGGYYEFQIHRSEAASNGVRITNSATSSHFGNGLYLGVNNLGEASVANDENTALHFFVNGSKHWTMKPSGALRYIPMATSPSSPEEGDTYYDSASKKLRTWDGTAWQDAW